MSKRRNESLDDWLKRRNFMKDHIKITTIGDPKESYENSSKKKDSRN